MNRRPKLFLIVRHVCHGLALTPLFAGCVDRASAGPASVEELPQLERTEQLRIGSVDDPDVGFSSIGAVTVDDEGMVYVLERQEREVRVYDAAGSLVGSMGRQGEGPGEFEFPGTLGLIGDTVWVGDPRLRRVSLFTRAGEFFHSYSPQPIPLELGSGFNVMLTASGLNRDGTLRSSWMIALPRDPPTDTIMIPIVRMDTTGAIVDTIRHVPWAFPPRNAVTINGREVPVPAAPSSSPLHVDAPDGGVFVIDRVLATSADAGVFTVRRFDAAGDTLYARAFNYRPRGYEGAVMDSLVGRYAGIFEMMGVDIDAARAQVRDAMVLPAFQPPIAAAEAGQDGTLWLRREDDGSALAHWIILNADGTPRGSLDLSRRASVHWVDGDIAWVAEPDEFDVPWLVKYRIADGTD